MSIEVSIEERLAAVESAVAAVQHQLASAIPNPNWIERFRGAFKDDPAFAEIVEYGRSIRAADRLPEDREP